MIEHCLYGVRVFCEFGLFDREVPASAVAPGAHAALELRQATSQIESGTQTVPLYSTHGREVLLHTDRPLAMSEVGQEWCLEVCDVASFYWTGGQSLIEYELHAEGSQALLVFWFVHIFLPLQLTLERGYDFIHSAAVEVDGEPILFIAPSTGGKSTLGDYFLQQDHPMLSDDKVATFLHEDEFWGVPSHPHHRPFRQFEVLGNPVSYFAAGPRPIHAFYVLEAGSPDDDVAIEEVLGFRKFEALMPNYLFGFEFLKKQRTEWLAQLADKSNVFRVHRPWDLKRQQEVYEAICAHSRGLG